MTYQHMAYVYDDFMKHAPYDQWVQFTIDALNKHGKQVDRILDLGCGTGEITLRLAKQGYQMYGIDNSLDMLSFAEQKAFQLGVHVNWLYQDLRELAGFSNIDLAISYCDVINYITAEEDIQEAFNRIYNSLAEEGLFIFDVHSLHHVENTLVNNTFGDVTDDGAYIWECLPGEVRGEMHHQLTFFKMIDDHYLRFDEFHTQRTYEVAYYEQVLQETGFQHISIYQDFSLKNENSIENAERIFFLAVK